MNRNVTTHAPRNAMLLGIATALASAGVLIWKTRRMRDAGPIRVERHGHVPVWARASSIVATSAGALLLLVREKT